MPITANIEQNWPEFSNKFTQLSVVSFAECRQTTRQTRRLRSLLFGWRFGINKLWHGNLPRLPPIRDSGRKGGGVRQKETTIFRNITCESSGLIGWTQAARFYLLDKIQKDILVDLLCMTRNFSSATWTVEAAVPRSWILEQRN